jgi:hypothetical protein
MIVTSKGPTGEWTGWESVAEGRDRKIGTRVLPSCTLCSGRRWLSLLLFSGLLLPAGCTDRGAQKARQEAADARAEVAKLELNLARAGQEISELKTELKAVRQTRDELQGQADQLQRDREHAASLARQAQDMITQLTARADNQAGATVALERQIAELKALVKDQQDIIEELQKGAIVAPETPEPSTEPADTEPSDDDLSPVEPNECP